MSENFDMILNRDKNLQKISQLSSDLKENSGKVSQNWFKLHESNKAVAFTNYASLHSEMTLLVVQKGCQEAETDNVAEVVCDLHSIGFSDPLLSLPKVLSFMKIFNSFLTLIIIF